MLGRLLLVEAHLALHELPEVDRREHEVEQSLLDALQVEEVVDQAREPHRLTVDGRDVGEAGLLIELAPLQELGEAEDACKRRPQLV